MEDLKRHDDRQKPGLLERSIMMASALFTIAVFAYVTYHAVTSTNAAQPTVEVTELETVAEGVRVHLEMRNEGGVGLRTVTVSVDCDTPPPAITFDNLPVKARRTGMVLCPPGTTNPQATVATWVET